VAAASNSVLKLGKSDCGYGDLPRLFRLDPTQHRKWDFLAVEAEFLDFLPI